MCSGFLLDLLHTVSVTRIYHAGGDLALTGISEVFITQSCLTVTPWTVARHALLFMGFSRILEWVAMPFSRGSSWPRDHTWVSCIAHGFFYLLGHLGSPQLCAYWLFWPQTWFWWNRTAFAFFLLMFVLLLVNSFLLFLTDRPHRGTLDLSVVCLVSLLSCFFWTLKRGCGRSSWKY